MTARSLSITISAGAPVALTDAATAAISIQNQGGMAVRVIPTATSTPPTIGTGDPGVQIQPSEIALSGDLLLSEIAPHLAVTAAFWWGVVDGTATTLRVAHA